MEQARRHFVNAVRVLDAPGLLRVLPQLAGTDLTWFRESWFSGELGEVNPTNVTCAADYAGEFLNLPEHAIALHDAALEYMDGSPDSIDTDTNCAAASLNLIDFLMKSGKRKAAQIAAMRAARMPVARGEQGYQLAVWLFYEFGLPTVAYPLFQRAKAAGLDSVSATTGVAVSDLEDMDRLLSLVVADRRDDR